MQAKQLNEKIEDVKKMLEKRDELKAADVREAVGEIQKMSLKLFEAAYKKMAAENQQSGGSSSDSSSDSDQQQQQSADSSSGGSQKQ